jgi:hypothetical protein
MSDLKKSQSKNTITARVICQNILVEPLLCKDCAETLDPEGILSLLLEPLSEGDTEAN